MVIAEYAMRFSDKAVRHTPDSGTLTSLRDLYRFRDFLVREKVRVNKEKKRIKRKKSKEEDKDENGESFNVYCLIRYYHNMALCVNVQLEDNRLMLTTWYPMPTDVTWTETRTKEDGTKEKVPKSKRKKIWNERRFGLLVYLKK